MLAAARLIREFGRGVLVATLPELILEVGEHAAYHSSSSSPPLV